MNCVICLSRNGEVIITCPRSGETQSQDLKPWQPDYEGPSSEPSFDAGQEAIHSVALREEPCGHRRCGSREWSGLSDGTLGRMESAVRGV